jgi:hypothetical protein
MKYADFYKEIDVEALESDLGLEAMDVKHSESRHRCPLPYGKHSNDDRTGKFYINRDLKVYNCWVCGGGSILSLVCELRGWTPEQSVEYLWSFTRPRNQTNEDFQEEIHSVLAFEDEDREFVMPHYSERVLDKYLDVEHEWFDQRNISESVKQKYKVCFARDSKRYGQDSNYEGPSIIMPHFWNGKLVGWQNRWLADDRPKWVPKYTNTPDLPKRETLFGWDFVKDEQEVPIVVVESVPTVLFLASQNVPAVATFGASVSEEQKKLLRRFQSGIIIAPDNDPAGANCAYEMTKALEEFVPVMQLPPVPGPDGSDLGDLLPQELPDFLERIYLV